jgi:hypothetical protein
MWNCRNFELVRDKSRSRFKIYAEISDPISVRRKAGSQKVSTGTRMIFPGNKSCGEAFLMLLEKIKCLQRFVAHNLISARLQLQNEKRN